MKDRAGVAAVDDYARSLRRAEHGGDVHRCRQRVRGARHDDRRIGKRRGKVDDVGEGIGVGQSDGFAKRDLAGRVVAVVGVAEIIDEQIRRRQPRFQTFEI